MLAFAIGGLLVGGVMGLIGNRRRKNQASDAATASNERASTENTYNQAELTNAAASTEISRTENRQALARARAVEAQRRQDLEFETRTGLEAIVDSRKQSAFALARAKEANRLVKENLTYQRDRNFTQIGRQNQTSRTAAAAYGVRGGTVQGKIQTDTEEAQMDVAQAYRTQTGQADLALDAAEQAHESTLSQLSRQEDTLNQRAKSGGVMLDLDLQRATQGATNTTGRLALTDSNIQISRDRSDTAVTNVSDQNTAMLDNIDSDLWFDTLTGGIQGATSGINMAPSFVPGDSVWW